MSGEIELEEFGFGSHSKMEHDHQNSVTITAPSLSEMRYEEDVEAGRMATCRICLETDVKKDDDMISPCMCKGTQQFVHRACLDHWRAMKEGFAFSHCTTCKAQFHLKVVKQKGISWPKIKFRLFVTRDVVTVFLVVQMVIALIGGLAYALDKSGSFKISFTANWDRIVWPHPLTFFYCIGVVFFFALVGFIGLVFHCITCNNDPRMAGCQNFCVGWAMLDCFPTSVEICAMVVIFLLVICVILGFTYGFLVATMAIQRIWQRHYHILTKKELTKEYVVEDLHGCYTPPKLDLEHVDRLIMLKLL